MRRSKIICKLFNFNLEQELDSKRFLLCKNNNLVAFIQDGNVISVDNNLLNSIENNKDLQYVLALDENAVPLKEEQRYEVFSTMGKLKGTAHVKSFELC